MLGDKFFYYQDNGVTYKVLVLERMTEEMMDLLVRMLRAKTKYRVERSGTVIDLFEGNTNVSEH